MKTQYNIKEINYTSYAMCTRLVDGLLSKNGKKPTTIQDIYDKFEETYHWAETYGCRLFPNESHMVRCKKIYHVLYEEAIWRLKKILDKGSGKSLLKYLVILDYPQDDNEKCYQYSDNGFSAFRTNKHGNTLDKLELAFIIDDMLSLGEPLSNDDIYKKLDEIFHLASPEGDYVWNCSRVYSKIASQAFQCILDELETKKRANALKILSYPKDKRKNIYQYEEAGFSAFKSPAPQNIHPLEIKFEAFASSLYSKYKLSLARLFDILERIDLISSSDTGSIEGDINKSLSKIESLIKCKTDDYIIECDKEFKLLFSKYKNHIKPKDYANLLVLYADHIYESGLNKDFKDSIDLKDGWYNTIANSLETAVNTISTTEYTELYINYALKYARFATQYNTFETLRTRTELYEKIQLLYDDIFNRLQNNNTPLMAYALRSYAMLCYFRENIDLSIEKLEQAQNICRSKINNTENASANLDYLSEYILATGELASIYCDHVDGMRRDINRSLNEYNDVVKHYCYLVEDNPHLGFDFIHKVYSRLAFLYRDLNDYQEVEKMQEKRALLSLSYAIKEKERKYIDRFEYDFIDWADTLRKVSRSTLKESYKQALEQYMQLGTQLSSAISNSNCEVYPKSFFSFLKSEVEAFQRIQEYRANQSSVENKICLAEELEDLGDLHYAIILSNAHEIVEEEYWEAFDIYQTINEDDSHTFTMLNLLGKLAKTFVSQNKMTDAGRMYGMLYNLVCEYIAEEEIEPLYEIDIAHLITDYALFLECNNEIDKSITIYEHALSFCDIISAHEQDAIELLLPDSSLPASVLPSKAIKCDILQKIAMLYEHKNKIKEAEKAYRKSIDFCLREEKETPGAYVIYIIIQLENFAKMLKDHCSYKEADTMISHYLDIINSSPEYYDALISKLPEFNWIEKAKQSVECTRELAKSEDTLTWYPFLAEELEELAEIQCIYKEYADAKDSYQEIIDIYSEMGKDRPGLYATDLASTYLEIASVCKELGMNDEAIQSYEKAKILYEKLSTSEPSYNAEVAKCLKAQAELYESYMNA